MSFRRAEFAAFILVFLLAIIFGGVGYFIVSDTGYDNHTISQEELARLEFWSSGLLNIATELVGAVALYLVFKVLFGFGGELRDKREEKTPAVLPEEQHHLWKKPLKEVVELLVRDKKLGSDSIGLFSRYKLPDGTELLSAQEVRELRAELAKPETAKGETK